MDHVAYRQFLKLEQDHWWFQGRRRSYFTILKHHLGKRGIVEGARLTVADVGCGMGGMLPDLRYFGDPVGIDADPESIQICHDRGFPRSFVGGGIDLPLEDQSHDLITLFDCLEHLEDDRAALNDIRRVLRPGAHAFFSVPAYQFLFSNNDRVAHHFRRYTRGDLVRKVEEAGLEVVKSTYVNVVLFPLILPAVLLLKARERLFPKEQDSRTNLSHTPPKLANKLLSAIFGGEGKILRYVSAPFGHSLVLLARRPTE